MAETYKDIKRQLDNLTYGNPGNPVECQYFDQSSCDGCQAESAYCDSKMLINLAKRVRKATKREFNIKATESLGFQSVGKDTRVAELESKLDKRLMPEGIEWPRFEDGDKITWNNSPDNTAAICLALDGSCYALHYDMPDDERMCIYDVSERVKRPVTEVLGADGLPIKVGETVYDGTGNRRVVVEVDTDRALVEFDGEPKRGWRASFITHTPPDTQKRIDEDARVNSYDYCKKRGLDLTNYTVASKRDLLRRQRELCAKGGE